ncbi:hypothetical protein BOX15_Mlig026163g1 [Macrostomum lignano]|uniref:Inositol polyphosphate-related phosphatase domain-containing protein n=1 Tax=Macrostomum lignano TaxID=282301 RepID=A0A267E061_9PLAT|nr:hypothetical protein BOX15_Mlig026163g1 [Macrostomum lignano]
MSFKYIDLSEFDPLSIADNETATAPETLHFQEDHYGEQQQQQQHSPQVWQPLEQCLKSSPASHNSDSSSSHIQPLELPNSADLHWFSADANGDNQREAKRHLLRDYLRERQREFTNYSDLLVHCGTWNVNNQFDDSFDLTEWLQPPRDQRAPDIYALGFQELDMSPLSNTMTYITQRSDREEKWIRLCQRCFPSSHCYSIVKTVRLLSTFLLVAAKDSLRNDIHSIRFGTQATGLMGFGPNKGGTAVRFQLGDTQFTFVNCHLAAGEDKLENRYNDFRDIQQKLKLMFEGTAGRYELLSHVGDAVGSHVTFFFGDLNFRLSGVSKEAVEARLFDTERPGAVEELLARHDELRRARAQARYGNIFLSYSEASIDFWPTYKYEIGSQRFDSEKVRVPSWCDRILYRAEDVRCEPLKYRSQHSYVYSDHKPVTCTFNTQVARVDVERQKRTIKRGVQWLDSLENAVLPQCTLEPGHEVQFGELSFSDTYRASLTLRNTGRVSASWQLMPTPGGEFSGVHASPVESRIPIGGSETIMLDATLGPCQWPQAVQRWAAGKADSAFAPGDVLVIALIGGPHIFAVPKGDIVPSCYGLPLACLCRLREPVLKTDRQSFRRLLRDCLESAGSSETCSNLGPPVHPIPVEVTRLLEATGDPDSPLLLPADPSEEDASMPSDSQLASIADALSRGAELPARLPPGAILQALLLLLHMLPDRPLLPGARQSQLARDLLSRVFAWARRLLKGPNWRHRDALVLRLARALDRPVAGSAPPSEAAIREVRRGLEQSANGGAQGAAQPQAFRQPDLIQL